MDGFTEETDILHIFTDKYNTIYNSVGFDTIDIDELLSNTDHNISKMCQGEHSKDGHLHLFDSNNVTKAVREMKSGKSDGYDGLTSDYIINCTPLMIGYITNLFNCIIRHGCIPSSFCISTLVPIPKSKLNSLSDSNNYRAIALSSLLCKLLDACIITKQSKVFQSHDLLFAYKSDHSTVQCVSMIREIVSYYKSKSTHVFMCMLDASKAFDKVNLLLLFKKLRLKGMCPLILRFIIKMYINQCIQVKWNNLKSEKCSISNGVKQGGVMSPLLFNLYVQDLIDCLDNQGLGCHMGNHFTGCFIYADDITLLAPSSDGMNGMLKTCEKYALEHDISFNPCKTKCMYFPYFKSVPGNISFMNSVLSYVKECTLLGVKILPDFSSDMRSFSKKFNK